MQKQCGRCQATFTCRKDDIRHCQCREVALSLSTQAYLQQTHYDCLCRNCLVELDKLVQQAHTIPFPRTGADFKEGVHFYRDQGRWVMTEFYLLQRGYCCGNGCRHCAYGYQPR